MAPKIPILDRVLDHYDLMIRTDDQAQRLEIEARLFNNSP